MYNKKHEAMKKEAIEAIMEALESGYDDYYCDLHNKLFNEDWYIIGTAKAKEALKEYDVFEAIELVQNYEEDNFGETNTDFSNPELLISMVWYVIGDEVIGEMNEIEAFSDNWNEEATEETNEVIVEAMRKMFN
jgi:hypothetical protein